MQIITITLGNKEFKLSCSKNTDQDKLKNIINIINDKLLKLKQTNPSSNLEILLVMLLLSSESENTILKEKYDEIDIVNNQNYNNIKNIDAKLLKICYKLSGIVNE
ncbi:cell division protein ZapA [Rickettsia endosymbiont of Cardiosporidium cionae]|uniref:cell division protein ZapA n=1 Tax=Rickettsia endosymbiont of Cardiosporidium cionae TaxID=2777155 RepID=UPI001895B970|nr:cell division protein ZapA [Rickettsia endosymbiont of Cardiosporidium cionae]KAF8818796.1 hypothetical protein IHI24_000030 [Rickettsia endosymbiont of Cardiosporidium cionae]